MDTVKTIEGLTRRIKKLEELVGMQVQSICTDQDLRNVVWALNWITGYDLDALKEKNRKRDCVVARMILCHLLQERGWGLNRLWRLLSTDHTAAKN